MVHNYESRSNYVVLIVLKPRNLRITLLSLFALGTLHAEAYAATSSTELQQAIASYNASDHQKAVSLLHAHLSKNQNDAVAHYYLANSLLKLNQQDEAMGEYRKAYELSKDPTLRQYCAQAIKQASVARKLEPEPHVQGKAESDVAKSLERIQRQIELARDNKIRNGDADAKVKLNRGNHDVSQLEAERDMKIHNLLQPDAISITGNPIYLDHSAEIEQVKRDYANRIKEAQILAKEESNLKKAEVAKDASKMVSDVDNLRSQLTDTHHLPGTPALQATGTNLYNRQYADPRTSIVRKPVVPPDELLATPEKMILDSRTTGGGNKYRIVKDPLITEQDKLKNHAPGTGLNVKGTLIRK